MNTMKTMLVACTVLMFSTGVSHAQLSGKDSSEIVNTSRNNELKFNRDYKGKTFSDVLSFKSASESIFGSSWSVLFGAVTCSGITDQSVLNEIIDWNKGEKVSVTGTVYNTILGTILLDNCRFAKK